MNNVIIFTFCFILLQWGVGAIHSKLVLKAASQQLFEGKKARGLADYTSLYIIFIGLTTTLFILALPFVR